MSACRNSKGFLWQTIKENTRGVILFFLAGLFSVTKTTWISLEFYLNNLNSTSIAMYSECVRNGATKVFQTTYIPCGGWIFFCICECAVNRTIEWIMTHAMSFLNSQHNDKLHQTFLQLLSFFSYCVNCAKKNYYVVRMY